MLRLACIFGTEAGIQICAPIHDAVMIIAPLHQLDADIVAMQGLMEKASEYVLDGFQTTNGTADYSLPRPLHEG